LLKTRKIQSLQEEFSEREDEERKKRRNQFINESNNKKQTKMVFEMDEVTDYDAVNWEYNQEEIPVRRILHIYTEDQRGQPIKEEDVCQPSNGRYTEGDYFVNPYGKQWKDISSMFRCPTYGSCTMCYKCGPVGKICSTCQGRDGYVILKVNRHKIVDAEHLATALGRGKETARADRKVQWVRQPEQGMSREALRIKFGLRQKQMGNPDYQRAGEQDYRRFLESIGES